MTMPTRYKFTLIALLLLIPGACTTESWYQGAQYAQTTQCMKGPESEYEDCIKQTTESYDAYERKREEVLNREKSQDDKN